VNVTWRHPGWHYNVTPGDIIMSPRLTVKRWTYDNAQRHVAWRRFDQSAKQLIVGHTTIHFHAVCAPPPPQTNLGAQFIVSVPGGHCNGAPVHRYSSNSVHCRVAAYYSRQQWRSCARSAVAARQPVFHACCVWLSRACSQLWLWCNCDATATTLWVVTTVQHAVTATKPAEGKGKRSIATSQVIQWRQNFVTGVIK